jgi:hypothetical protein
VSGGRLVLFTRGLGVARCLSAVGLVALLVTAPYIPGYVFGITVPVALATAVIILDVLNGGSWLARLLKHGRSAQDGSAGLYLGTFRLHEFGALKLRANAPYLPYAWA